MREKLPPTGYVTPANWRRFMAKNGSGRVLSFTSAATTVVGTVASCHPCGTKAEVAMVSPLASILVEDCSVQWSRRTNLSACGFEPAGLEAMWSAPRTRCEARNDITNKCARRRLGKAGRDSLANFMLLPCAPKLERACQCVSADLGPGTRWITRLLIRFNR